MAEITASDVTVSTNVRDRNIGHKGLDKYMGIFTIAFGDDALTYPADGVPLPAIGKFGLERKVDFMAIQGDPDDGFVYKYDATNHTIRIYTQGVVTGSTGVSADSTGALVENSDGNEGTAELLGGSPDTTYDLGPMIELPITVAPAATSLRALVVGE